MDPIEGTASHVQIRNEDAGAVLQFVFQSDQAQDSFVVEMRGQQIRGMVNDGDRISLGEGSVRGQDGIAHPDHVENLTIHSTVTVVRREWPSKLLSGPWTAGIISAVMGAIAGSITTKFFNAGASQNFTFAPGNTGGSDFWVIGALVGLAVASLVYRPLRRLMAVKSISPPRKDS
jgi:hypothetical protein